MQTLQWRKLWSNVRAPPYTPGDASKCQNETATGVTSPSCAYLNQSPSPVSLFCEDARSQIKRQSPAFLVKLFIKVDMMWGSCIIISRSQDIYRRRLSLSLSLSLATENFGDAENRLEIPEHFTFNIALTKVIICCTIFTDCTTV